MEPYKDRDLIGFNCKAKHNLFCAGINSPNNTSPNDGCLSSQSNLAGYKAVIEAFTTYGKAFPMMMTAAGTVPPAKCLVMGASCGPPSYCNRSQAGCRCIGE